MKISRDWKLFMVKLNLARLLNSKITLVLNKQQTSFMLFTIQKTLFVLLCSLLKRFKALCCIVILKKSWLICTFLTFEKNLKILSNQNFHLMNEKGLKYKKLLLITAYFVNCHCWFYRHVGLKKISLKIFKEFFYQIVDQWVQEDFLSWQIFQGYSPKTWYYQSISGRRMMNYYE